MRNIIIFSIAVILATAGAFAALRKSSGTAKVVVTPSPAVKKDKEQEAILRELSALLHKMDTVTVMTIAGSIKAQDLADSTASMQTEFLYTRNGDVGYYKMGEAEMISLKEGYISIDHSVKKIFLSAPKEVMSPLQVSLNTEVEVMENEGYHVTRKTVGALSEISLKSSTHITCREYTVSFDSAGIIHTMNTRLTDPMEPKNTERDKLLQLTIKSWQTGKARTDLLKPERYVAGNVPAAAFRSYELIREY